MKLLPITIALAVALAFASCEKLPQARRVQATSEIEMDLLIVRLPENRAMALVPKLRDPRQAADATKEVLKLVADREATLLGWPFLATKSGQRAVAEQIDEFRYATEYDPPASKKVTETPASDSGVASPPASSESSTTEPPVSSKPASTKTTNTIHEAMPAEFETRNLGITFEVEPVIGPDARTIDLNLVPQHVRLRGMRKVTIEGPKEGSRIVVEQPEVLNHRITTSISVQDGDHTLLGVFNVPDMPGQMELFILHTRIKRIEVPASEPPRSPDPAVNGPAADLSSPASLGRE